MNHDVFVSYSSKDKGVAEAVCRSLEEEGVRCWIAPRDIRPGEEYADAIIEALNSSRVFLVILSEESNASPQVRREVERAVSKDLQILTFRIDNTLLSKAMEYYLSNRHWLDASSSVFSKQLHNLSEAVQKLLGQNSLETEKPEPLESSIDSEPVTPVPPEREVPGIEVPPPVPAKSHKKQGQGWAWALVVVVVLAALSYFGWLMRADLPFIGWATATNTPRPTNTRNFAATQRIWDITSTAKAFNPGNNSFSVEALSQIANRIPDFQDDFSDLNWSLSHWKSFDGVQLANGEASILVSDQWHGMGFSADSSDFVIKFTITLSDFTAIMPSLGLSFREDESGFNHFTMNFDDGWCGFGRGGSENDVIFEVCQTSYPGSGQTILFTGIVQGDQAEAFLNYQPLLYHFSEPFQSGMGISIGVSVPEGTGKMIVDDVQYWNLNK